MIPIRAESNVVLYEESRAGDEPIFYELL